MTQLEKNISSIIKRLIKTCEKEPPYTSLAEHEALLQILNLETSYNGSRKFGQS